MKLFKSVDITISMCYYNSVVNIKDNLKKVDKYESSKN